MVHHPEVGLKSPSPCSDECEPDPEILKIQRMLLVKFSNVSLAQKASRFKGALLAMFGNVNESGPDMLGSTKGALSRSWPNKIVFKKM